MSHHKSKQNTLKIDKGTLKKGSDADICIVDINKPWVVNAGELKSKSKNTAIEDKKLQGKVMMTFLQGELVFKGQNIEIYNSSNLYPIFNRINSFWSYFNKNFFKKRRKKNFGSGNIGATNVLRTGNKVLAFLTLFFDVLKGYFIVVLIEKFYPNYVFNGGLICFLGHIFPIWLKFKRRQRYSNLCWNTFSFILQLGNSFLFDLVNCFIFFRYSSLSSILGSLIIFIYLLTKIS